MTTAPEAPPTHLVALPARHRPGPPAPPAAALAIGVVGARGGAGAGVLAATLARCSAATGRATLLADADPLGTGVAWTMAGAAEQIGPAPRLGAGRGRLLPGSLLGALPEVDGVHLFSRAPWGPEPRPESMPDVLDSAVRDFDVLVVDLPRRLDAVAAAFAHALDVALLVVPADRAAVRAAGHLAGSLSGDVADLRLVVRGPEPRGLSWHAIGEELRLPVQARLAPEPGLDRALGRGEPPGLRRRSPLRRTAAAVLDDFLAHLAAADPAGRDRPFADRRTVNHPGGGRRA